MKTNLRYVVLFKQNNFLIHDTDTKAPKESRPEENGRKFAGAPTKNTVVSHLTRFRKGNCAHLFFIYITRVTFHYLFAFL